MSKASYLTIEEADMYYRVQRLPDVRFEIHDDDAVLINAVRTSCMSGQPAWFSYPTHPGSSCTNHVYGFVTDIDAPFRGLIKVTVKPTASPQAEDHARQQANGRIDRLSAKRTRLNLDNLKEPDMKLFEAVVVTVDEKGEITGVAKIVEPFAAKTQAAGRDSVLIDFAQEKALTGKDLAGYSVRIREFCASL